MKNVFAWSNHKFSFWGFLLEIFEADIAFTSSLETNFDLRLIVVVMAIGKKCGRNEESRAQVNLTYGNTNLQEKETKNTVSKKVIGWLSKDISRTSFEIDNIKLIWTQNDVEFRVWLDFLPSESMIDYFRQEY